MCNIYTRDTLPFSHFLSPKIVHSMPTEGILVSVRARPLNERERNYTENGKGWIIDTESNSIRQDAEGKQSMTFDRVFGDTSTNEDVYADVAKPVVQSGLGGINGTIFAYGQTSSGKTFSMTAIMDMGFAEVFNYIANESGHRRFVVKASYLEIYNEELTDLLEPGKGKLAIRASSDHGGAYVAGLSERLVTSVADVKKLLAQGQASRQVGATAMNEQSSRSHTIFTLSISSEPILAATSSNASISTSSASNGRPATAPAATAAAAVGSSSTKMLRGNLRATINFVDLAGSERAAQTQATGQRLKEGSFINLSLLTLGTVIRKLSDPKTAQHVPFRESKLTRILQPALGGNNKTSILCCFTQSEKHLEETINTLRFALRAKKICNSVEVNEVMDDKSLIIRLRQEIAFLKAKLLESAALIAQQLPGVAASRGSRRAVKTGAKRRCSADGPSSAGDSNDDNNNEDNADEEEEDDSQSALAAASQFQLGEGEVHDERTLALLRQNASLSQRVSELTQQLYAASSSSSTSSSLSADGASAIECVTKGVAAVVAAVNSVSLSISSSEESLMRHGLARTSIDSVNSMNNSTSSASSSSSSSFAMNGIEHKSNAVMSAEELNADNDEEEAQFFARPVRKRDHSSVSSMDDEENAQQNNSDDDDDGDDDDDANGGGAVRDHRLTGMLTDVTSSCQGIAVQLAQSRQEREAARLQDRQKLQTDLTAASNRVVELESLLARMENAVKSQSRGSDEREGTLVDSVEALGREVSEMNYVHQQVQRNLINHISKIRGQGYRAFVALGEEIQDLSEEACEQRRLLAAAQQQVEEVQNALAEAEARAADALAAAEKSASQAARAQEDVDAARAKVKELEIMQEEALEKVRQVSRERDDAEDRADTALSVVSEASAEWKSEREALEADLENAVHRAEVAEAKLSDLEVSASRKAEDAAAASSHVDEFRSQLEQARQHLLQRERELAELKASTQMALADAQEDRAELKSELDRVTARIQAVLSEQRSAQDAIDRHKARVTELEEAMAFERERTSVAEERIRQLRVAKDDAEFAWEEERQKTRLDLLRKEEEGRRAVEVEKLKAEEAARLFAKERRELESKLAEKVADLEHQGMLRYTAIVFVFEYNALNMVLLCVLLGVITSFVAFTVVSLSFFFHLPFCSLQI